MTTRRVTAGPRPKTGRDVLDVALVVPLHGTAGIFGPSCELCAQLAAEELNQGAGVLGRELRLSPVDGSRSPRAVADEVGALVAAGLVDAVVGWHLSAVRQALAPRIAGRVPYVYTALYEGGERTPGVFLAGETPSRQLLPAMRWLREEHGVRRWCTVGNDYVWPRGTARAAREYAARCGGEIVDEIFLPLGTRRFEPIVERVGRARPDAVLMLLVGQDAVQFNRTFAQSGLDERCLRLSTLMEENMLLASGAESTRGICASAGYFETLTTAESLEFGWRYTRRYGPDAPTLNSLGESCYEGVLMLDALARRARGVEVSRMSTTCDTAAYAGARGEVRIRDRHADQPIYLAEASGLEFDVIARVGGDGVDGAP